MVGIPTRLLMTTVGALTVGMLLVNFVLLGLWHSDALQREQEYDRLVLSSLHQKIAFPKNAASQRCSSAYSCTDFYSDSAGSGCLLSCSPASSLLRADINGQQKSLSTLLDLSLKKAITHNQPVILVKGTLLTALFAGRLILVRAEPIEHNGRVVAAIGVVRNLTSVANALRKAQKTIIIYIFVNLFFLGLAVYFRIRKLVAAPLRKLVDLADQYQETGSFSLALQRRGSEFFKLAASLNRMLATIESDKQKLEDTVNRLVKANKELERHQEEMVRTEKLASVGRMAAGLAHEIGNPLGVIQGYLGLLGRSGVQVEAAGEYIQRAEKELQRINGLIRQLLDFARVPAGKYHVVSLHTLLDDMVGMLSVQPNFRQIKLKLYKKAKNDTVKADPDQLRQVFLNCLLNSADAILDVKSGEKGIIEIEISNTDDGRGAKQEWVQVILRDNGIGIDKKSVTSVFDPFYTTKEPGRGTGLGLSVALTIVESFGGKMTMQSEPGKGSTLLIVFPIHSGCNHEGADNSE